MPYNRQADQVLAVSAALTDEQKLIAEHFNDKFASLGLSGIVTAQNAGLSLERFVQYHFAPDVAALDAAADLHNPSSIW